MPSRVDLDLPRALIWVGLGLTLFIGMFVLYINTAGDFADRPSPEVLRAYNAEATARVGWLGVIVLGHVLAAVAVTISRWIGGFAFAFMVAGSVTLLGLSEIVLQIRLAQPLPVGLGLLLPGTALVFAGAAVGLRRLRRGQPD